MSLLNLLLGRRRKGFVLALGGGGGRGLAHVGVFEVLEEHGLRPSAIVGTSIGALFGALYALNPDARATKASIMRVLASDLFLNLGLPNLESPEMADQSWLSKLSAIARQSVLYTRAAFDVGVLSSEPLIQVAREFCDEHSFADCQIPLYVTAVEFPSGECHLFSAATDTDLRLALAASTAVPGAFDPVRIGDKRFVDGGIAAELPSREAQMIARSNQIVVAVNVGARPDPEREPRHVIAMLDWTTQIKSLYLRRHKRELADVLIEPLVGFRQWQDFSSPEAEIERGRQAALEKMPELMRLLRA
ncbi:MAG TPA: patatin-like phospholipase family protein [Mariprofundaceae bacterium]|nr:patatin-like phospholipase family protein [Mariprofundaceae bacterium]